MQTVKMYRPETGVDLAVLDSAINRLRQATSTMQIVLENIFKYDYIDLKGTEQEIMKAMEVCNSYPAWRETLAMVWEQMLKVREDLADEAIGGVAHE